MSRLVWDAPDARVVRYGVGHGVVYPRTVPPVVWNGLLSVNEALSEADLNAGYLDGQRYVQQRSPSSFSATVEAFTFPDELDVDETFDLSYRVLVQGGYELHLVYNASVSSKEIDRTTESSDDPDNFQWDLFTVPERLDSARATAHIILSSLDASSDALDLVETLLYGEDDVDPRIPHLPELLSIFESLAVFVVTDNGDGTWTATGPDEYIEMIDSISFKITTPSITFDTPTTYRIRSW